MISTNLKNARQRLASRRGSEASALENGLSFAATASRFDDDPLGGVFLQNLKADSTAGIMASDAAIVISPALQFGCLLDVWRYALMRDGQCRAMSPIGAALDLVAFEDENEDA